VCASVCLREDGDELVWRKWDADSRQKVRTPCSEEDWTRCEAVLEKVKERGRIQMGMGTRQHDLLSEDHPLLSHWTEAIRCLAQ